MSWRSSPTYLVARREVFEAWRSKGTKIFLAISVVAVFALIIGASFLGGDGDEPFEVVVVDPAPGLAERIEQIGGFVGDGVEVRTVDDDEAATAAVDDGADLAVLGTTDGPPTLLTDEPIDADDTSPLATLVNVLSSDFAIAAAVTADDSGAIDWEAVDAAYGEQLPDRRSIESAGDDDDGLDTERIGFAMTTNVALFIMLQVYGTWVLQGVTREKSSRVVEVLLAAITPRQLLLGKIIGIGCVALTNAAALGASAIIAIRLTGTDVLGSVGAGDVVTALVWFVLGYALYCTLFGAAGALCDKVEDAQAASMPVMAPLLVAYIAGFAALGGATPVLWILAFFPPTAVLAMPVLYSTGEVPVWSLVLSMAATVVAIAIAAAIAVRVYERSILRTGKRVSWRNALRR